MQQYYKMKKKITGGEKAMDNVPCGDSTVDGYCGNDLERLCIGELIYEAAAAQKGYLQRLRSTIKSCFGAYIFNSELFVW